MTPERRRAILSTTVPFAVCAGVAVLLGCLLRPAEPPNVTPSAPAEPAETAEAAAPVEVAEAAKPAETARPAPILVQVAAPVEVHYDPLPPLPPGTTTQDLLHTYVEEVCSCDDMACVDEAILRHNRYFGQAVRVRKAVDNRALDQRAGDCIAQLRHDENGG